MSARTGVCATCTKPVLWARTKTGQAHPLDREPVLNGNVEVDEQGRALVVRPDPEVARYRSHFATCPHAPLHRRFGGRGKNGGAQ